MGYLNSLTIVMPAFNEERIIRKAIISARKAARQVSEDYEIVVVNDGSRDQTGQIISSLAYSDKHVRGIFFDSQQGYARALSSGIYASRKEFVFYTDADLPVDIEKELSKAASLAMSEGADAVIGYRINRQDSFLRKIYSVTYNSLGRSLFGIKARDINFSCKLFRREIFESFHLFSCSVFIDAEILANLSFYGFKIKEFPAVYMPRLYGRSNFNSLIYALKVLLEMIAFRIKFRRRDKKRNV